jgi:hypothetical protein
MTTTHTRRTTLTVRSEACFEEMHLGTVRAFLAECDKAGLSDHAVISWNRFGDSMVQLVAEATQYEDLDAPAEPFTDTADELHGGWVDPSTGLVSGGYSPVLEANDREAAGR